MYTLAHICICTLYTQMCACMCDQHTCLHEKCTYICVYKSSQLTPYLKGEDTRGYMYEKLIQKGGRHLLSGIEQNKENLPNKPEL